MFGLVFFGDYLLGPFVVPSNLKQWVYLQLLEETVDKLLTEIIENSDRIQYGAPPHNVQLLRQYFDPTFPGGWIVRRGTNELPPRSPDVYLPQCRLVKLNQKSINAP